MRERQRERERHRDRETERQRGGQSSRTVSDQEIRTMPF